MNNFVYEMTGNVPFLGTTVSMIVYNGEMFPILDAPKGVIRGLNRTVTATSPQSRARGFIEFAGSTGAILGVPGSAQSEQLSRGFIKAQGRESELDKLLGLKSRPQTVDDLLGRNTRPKTVDELLSI